MRLATKDIGTILFDVYYNREKNYQPGLKLGTDGDKVVGTELGRILLRIQLLQHADGKNLLLLHHQHVT